MNRIGGGCWIIAMALAGAATGLRADSSPSDGRVAITFKDASWDEVLRWVGDINQLTIQVDAPPPGKFTYSEPRKYTPEEAYDLIHGALLDRGLTMIRKGGLVMVSLLGDDMPWELVPFVPADRLEHIAPHEIVSTTVRLYRTNGSQMAAEIEGVLTPRGRVLGNKVARRLVVQDQAAVCLGIRDLINSIDPPTDSSGQRVRVYRLTHARAKEVEPIVRELLGPMLAPPMTGSRGGGAPGGPPRGEGGGPPPMMPGMDPSAFTNVLFNRKFLSSFTPGYSLQGVGQEAPPKEKMPARLSIEAHTNSLSVYAEEDVLGRVDEIVAALDRASEGDGASPILIKSYTVRSGNAEDVAARLRELLSDTGGLTIKGIDRVLVVRGTASHHRDVERLMATLTGEDESMAGFRLARRRASDLVPQIERLFEIDGKSAPRVVADPVENALLVRGSKVQIEQVRKILTELGETAVASPAGGSTRP
jgi:type II secretory pathway component GspD/PulD (secretin)